MSTSLGVGSVSVGSSLLVTGVASKRGALSTGRKLDDVEAASLSCDGWDLFSPRVMIRLGSSSPVVLVDPDSLGGPLFPAWIRGGKGGLPLLLGNDGDRSRSITFFAA